MQGQKNMCKKTRKIGAEQAKKELWKLKYFTMQKYNLQNIL